VNSLHVLVTRLVCEYKAFVHETRRGQEIEHFARLGPDRRTRFYKTVLLCERSAVMLVDQLQTLVVGVPQCARMAQLTESIKFDGLTECPCPRPKAGPRSQPNQAPFLWKREGRGCPKR
jgi:hypothetical protein